MKLVICIIHNRDKNRVTDKLIEAGFKFTIIGSTGGFLREGNTTLMIGTEPSELDPLMELFKEFCCAREQIINVGSMEAPAGLMGAPVKVPVGGAVVFVLDVGRFERF
ncbi:MAG: cyclic-di-AMP receptor [Fimbriimonadaceae bacterium]